MLGRLTIIWFVVSLPIVLWDAAYILERPRSMAGGDLHWIWAPYDTYIQADGRYGDINDGFGIGQSWMNLFEVALAVFAILKHLCGDASCELWAFASVLSTFTKTALYFLTEICSGFEYTGHSLAAGDYFTFLVHFVIPSSFWLIIPLLLSISYGWSISSALTKKTKTH